MTTLKRCVPRDRLTLATVARLLLAIEEQYIALAKWLPHVRIAVNCAYAEPDLLIEPGDEIALIPPVAGGAGVPL